MLDPISCYNITTTTKGKMMEPTMQAFVTKAADVLEQVNDEDPDQVGLNALMAIMQQMAKGVLTAAALAIMEDNQPQIERLAGQAEVLTALLAILSAQRDAIDAAELTPDLVDELEQILNDAV